MLVWEIRGITLDQALAEQGETLAAQFGSQYDLRPVWGHREGDRRRDKVALSAGEVAALWPGGGFTLRLDGSLPTRRVGSGVTSTMRETVPQQRLIGLPHCGLAQLHWSAGACCACATTAAGQGPR
jgi:hypothetical protein